VGALIAGIVISLIVYLFDWVLVRRIPAGETLICFETLRAREASR